jgi:hypothetical protein
MLLRWERTALLAFVTFASASPAWAWDPLKSAGRSLGAGAAEGIQPVLTYTVDQATASAHGIVADVDLRASKLVDQATTSAHGIVADVDTRAERLVDRAGGVASQLIGQTQGALADTVDRIDGALGKRIMQIDRVAASNLNRADSILRERSDQLGRLVQDRLAQADSILSERIDQLDEAVGRRLGNVDVIATKQRLAIEATAVRVAVLVAVVVFVVFVLVSLWRKYPEIVDKVADKRGAYRTWGFVKGLARPLGLQLLGAWAALVVLLALYQWLPMGARKEAAATVARHEAALAQSLASFDFLRARFHASQLELLTEGDSLRYQAQSAKAELLRDLLARPALLTSDSGLRTVMGRVQGIESKLGPGVDPDVLTLKAMVLWQVGHARSDEYEAASLCTRALRTPGQNFALAPLARNYVRSFLDAPYLADDAPLDRTHESLATMRAVLALGPGDPPDFPLAAVIALDRAMIALDHEVSAAYVDMVRAHAEVVRLNLAPRIRRGKARATASTPALPTLAAAQETRKQAALSVLAAWRRFDATLDAIPGLGGNASVLAVFRLDDATFTRAAWFVENPTATDVAPLAADITNLDDARKQRLAPPRVQWERRYRALVDDSLRGVFAFQEADRFRAFERQARAFELAFVRYQLSPGDAQLRLAAAQAAAAMGLLVPSASGSERVSLAVSLLGALPAGKAGQDLAQQLAARKLRLL